MTDINKDTCWYREDGAAEMNRFYDIEVKGHDLSDHGHIKVIRELLRATDSPGTMLMDVGCGTAMLSEYAKEFQYYGCDLPHILSTCAMRNYPDHYYHACDLNQDDMAFIHQAEIVVANGLIDVMERPLEILGKLLQNTRHYFILHRQEMTFATDTHVIRNGSYGSTTFHSIIHFDDLFKLLEANDFEVVKTLNCSFGNWYNGGHSFLLRKRKSWALNELDYKLKKHIGPKRNGFFIEAGANDGLRQSNTMFFEFYLDWSGILIEPVHELSVQARINRSAKTQIVNCALVGTDYHQRYIEIVYTPECHGLMSVVNDEHAAEVLAKAKEPNPQHEQVPAKRLTDVLDVLVSRGQHIDLLVLDMEGYEAKALTGMDFSTYKPNWILVEDQRGDNIIPGILAPWYEFCDKLSDHDYLFKRISDGV